MALFDHTPNPGTVTEKICVYIQIVLRDNRFIPIEFDCPVWTSSHTVPTTDTPIIINGNDAIGLLPHCVNRTYLYAGRVFALHTLDRQIIKTVLGHVRRIVIVITFLEIRLTILHPNDPDVMNLHISGNIVFAHTGMHTFSAAYTF